MDALIEVVTLPVTDIDATIDFYRDAVGFVVDVDYRPTSRFRVVQMTPPGSRASIQFGLGLVAQPTAPLTGLYLVVDGIAAFRDELVQRGVRVDDPRHKDSEAGWHGAFLPGWDPDRTDYGSFTGFTDPDGNRWVVQERGYRLPSAPCAQQAPPNVERSRT